MATVEFLVKKIKIKQNNNFRIHMGLLVKRVASGRPSLKNERFWKIIKMKHMKLLIKHYLINRWVWSFINVKEYIFITETETLQGI